MNYVDFFKWVLSLGKDSRFLPKLAFSKREGVFTLYYYPSKDSYICRYKFFYDGGEVLPVIGEWGETVDDLGIGQESYPVDLPALISKYFSFNITSLRKAIHRRGMSKTNSSLSSSDSSNSIGEKANAPYRSVILKPRIALINKDFFGQRQVRVKKSAGSRKELESSWHSRLSSSQELLLIAKQAAASFDFNLFPNFFSLAKSLFPSISEKIAFSIFKKFVLDFQSS